MLNVVTYITITQKSNNTFPTRDKVLSFDFCSEYEIESTWKNLTDTCELVMPKDVYARDENGKVYSLAGTNKNIGAGETLPPLFLTGDEIAIDHGYILEDGTLLRTGADDIPSLFRGFITEIKSQKPIVLACQDYMYALKQIPAPDNDWKNVNISDMFTEILSGTPYTVSDKSSITINYSLGSFITAGETAAQVLERLRKEYRFESYFRGAELRIGYPIYYTEEAVNKTFQFQENIIDSDLTYNRKDDVVLSAIASTKVIKDTGNTTKDGTKKTKTEALEILVELKNGAFTYQSKPTGGSFPANVEGERRKLFFTNVTTEEGLFELAKPELEKYYYTGFKGSFKTFGMPFVRHGDNAVITNPLLPDQDGTYKIKKVVYTGGINGLRQNIYLDYKVA